MSTEESSAERKTEGRGGDRGKVYRGPVGEFAVCDYCGQFFERVRTYQRFCAGKEERACGTDYWADYQKAIKRKAGEVEENDRAILRRYWRERWRARSK